MEITVNQQVYSVPESCVLQHVLDGVLALPLKGIAIAVNQEIISRQNWESHVLQHLDNLTIIKATQGG
ncbi:sulfur carrier protein ThiS [Pedobacter sp. MC2016-14]|uniref:sulfur carrier protein ThiS n=1 Tax=Pedobacter sp. MC2016-14 TaxID=2897327 RepID=UPI001E46D50E|nr:sulfur carrier protein ThiS [Pedobacter sp. MC2016-14]MCD0489906.1 sulfur carrier protein ThiS [Pedobacter sp. MC2016-14]